MTRLELVRKYPELMAHLAGIGSVTLLGQVLYTDEPDDDDGPELDLPAGITMSDIAEEPVKYIDIRCHAAFTHQSLAMATTNGFHFVQAEPDYGGQIIVTFLAPDEQLPQTLYKPQPMYRP